MNGSRGAATIVAKSNDEVVKIDAAPYSAGDIECEIKGRISNDTPRCSPANKR
jgi:hypothetical protein